MNGQWHQSGAGGEAMKYKMFTQSQPLNGFLFWINYVIFIEDQLVCLSLISHLCFSESTTNLNLKTVLWAWKQSTNQPTVTGKAMVFWPKASDPADKWQWASEGCNLAWKLNTRILHCTAASVHVQSVWLLSVCVWV